MIVVAIAFYVIVGALIFSAIFGKKSSDPPNQPSTSSPQSSQSNGSSGAQSNGPSGAAIAEGCIGLAVVAGMIWVGGTYGYGNAIIPKASSPSYVAPTQPKQQDSDVWVQPYVRQDGTYAPGHYRSAHDFDPTNNYSTVPNVNPYTGKPGTRTAAPPRAGSGQQPSQLPTLPKLPTLNKKLPKLPTLPTLKNGKPSR